VKNNVSYPPLGRKLWPLNIVIWMLASGIYSKLLVPVNFMNDFGSSSSSSWWLLVGIGKVVSLNLLI